ncbi:MAG TPA: hypothetical protein VE758_03255 [Chthoniobacterales bacterium]|nr:hypothetical protein [Chthoniobacterales bacterium]
MSSELRCRVVAACALGLLISSCGSSSQEAEQSGQMLRSWIRTVDLAAQQHVEHRVPDLYLKQLLKSAEQALKREQRQIQQLSGSDRQQLGSLADQLEGRIRQEQLTLHPRVRAQR